MADAVTAISENIVWIILAVLATIVIIIVVTQWKKVRETQNNVALVEKQVELKKISLVEKDLRNKTHDGKRFTASPRTAGRTC